MDVQTLWTDFCQVELPADWEPEDFDEESTTYLEAPDGTAGVFLTTWLVSDQTLMSALFDAREVESEHLPDSKGSWTILQRVERQEDNEAELLTEYFNATSGYLIVTRLLGRGDTFVRLAFHDYDARDASASAANAERWVRSLTLRDGASGLAGEWIFDQTPETAAITTKRVLEDGLPIVVVQHFAGDHSWSFLCGTTNDTRDGRVISMREVLELDPSLRVVAALPPGWVARRGHTQDVWSCQPEAQ